MALYTKIKGPVNYTVVGNVTINNGIASGFGSNYNYIKSNTPLITNNNPWVAILKVNFGSSIPVTWRLFATEGGPTNAIGFLLGSNSSTQLYVWLAVEGYSGWKYSQVKGSLVLQTNTDYYLRMGWTGSVYYIDYSLDGINYTRDITINESIPMKNGSNFMTIGGTREYNSGSNTIIYLDETSININNVAWFGTSFSKVKAHIGSSSRKIKSDNLFNGYYIIEDGKLKWANPNIYLQSSGTQYIDTDYIANNSTTIETYCKFGGTFTTGTDKQYIFGCADTPKVYAFCANFGGSSGQYNQIFFWVKPYTGGSGWSIINNNYNIIQKISIDNTKATWGTNTKTLPSREAECPYSMLLFGCKKDGISYPFQAWTNMFIYGYYKIYDNGKLIRHFVPVPTGLQIGDFTVPSNGMFDIVNQQFYPNQGTGTFTYGKDA